MVKQKRWGKKVEYVRDWRTVNEIYVVRSEYYLDFGWVQNWDAEVAEINKGKTGAPFQFPDSLIELQADWLHHFSYRGAEGITRKFVELGHLPKFNDYSTIQRRVVALEMKLPKSKHSKISVATDGSGMKMNMSGEYFEQMYGRGKRKKFIKVVVTTNPCTKDILEVSVSVEGEGKSEPAIARDHIGKLQKDGITVGEFFGDGSFDAHKMFDFCDMHRIRPVIKIRKDAVITDDGSWRRNVEIQKYREKGYKKWARENGYGRRWVGTEGVFSSVKRIFSELVRARNEENMCLEARRKFRTYQKMKRYAEEKLEIRNHGRIANESIGELCNTALGTRS